MLMKVYFSVDFPNFKISNHLPMFSEDSPKLVQRHANVAEHFPKFPKATADFRMLLKISEEDQKMF